MRPFLILVVVWALGLSPAPLLWAQGETPGEESPAPPKDTPEAAPGESPENPPDDPKPDEDPGEEGPPPPAKPSEDLGVMSEGEGRFKIAVLGRPLQKVFEGLFEVSGRTIPLDFPKEAPKIDLALEGASFWEAVDGIARAGRAYVWGAFASAGPRLRLLPASEGSPLPVSHSGPVRMSIECCLHRLRYGPGLGGPPPLELKGWVLPEPGIRLLGRRGLSTASSMVTFKAVDDQGKDLTTHRAFLSRVGDGFQLTLYMHKASPEAKRIAVLDIALDLELIGAFEEIEVVDVAQHVGSGVDRGDIRLTIEEIQASSLIFTVHGEGSGVETPFRRVGAKAPSAVRLLDGEGNEVPVVGFKVEGLGEAMRYRVEMAAAPPPGLTLKYKAVKGRERRTFRFAFKDLSLTE
ncbi:MAG: hypothetical protein ACYTHM_06935 [Planctomycetota bacterium]|jgi:hypothetical protein